MARNRSRLPQSPIGSAPRYLIRLITFMCVGVAAICLLGTQASRRNPADDPDIIQTAMAPSPFAHLGAGVFVSEPVPEETEAPAAPPEPASTPQPVVGPDGLPQVNKQLLQRILDKTTSIPAAAYYHLVNIAAQTPAELLKKHAATEQQVTFAHLRNDPDKFRGELVYLKGYLRTLSQFEASTKKVLNPTGITHLYQGDLFTDAARPNPYVIIVPEIPAGLPLGKDLTENVTFVGYFLKQWRYKTAADVDRAAPLLIGRIISWTPAPVVREGRSREYFYYGLAASLLVVGLGVAFWFVRRAMLNRRRALGFSSDVVLEPDAVHADLARLEQDESQPDDA